MLGNFEATLTVLVDCGLFAEHFPAFFVPFKLGFT